MSVSLDGFIEAACGYLSWTNPDEEPYLYMVECEKMTDIHFYGRGMYENMASFWPTADKNPSALPIEKEYASFLARHEKDSFFKNSSGSRLEFTINWR
jgi:dihydrofolate reductase